MKGKRSKIGRRGKIGLTILIAAMFIGVASAGYLTYYNTVTVKANVEQSVLVDGKDVNEPITQPDLDAMGGGTYYFKHDIKNRAPINATVNFVTIYKPVLNKDDSITATTVYALKESKTTLELTSKDPNTWQPTNDMKATLTFDTVAPTFNYEFEATGLEIGTSYDLIYYADFDDRFNIWGGNNPGAFIATFITDPDGNIAKTKGNVNLGMNLPTPPDWNIGPEADYTKSPDEYEHANGAKIWLVPSESYDRVECKVTSWQPTKFLFETDLIIYLDCNKPVEYSVGKIIVDQYATDVTTGLTIKPGETEYLLFCYIFDIGLTGEYTITTNVNVVRI